nr:hypothetical protein [Ruminococcus sp. AF46-10NS]
MIQSSTEDPTLEIETDNSSDSSDGNGTGIPDATDDGTYSESDSDESASDESSSSDESGSSDETASDENASEGTDQEENSSDEAGIRKQQRMELTVKTVPMRVHLMRLHPQRLTAQNLILLYSARKLRIIMINLHFL